MVEEISFFSFQPKEGIKTLTLSGAEKLQVYLGIECRTFHCDNKKLMHPSDIPVSPNVFDTFGIAKIANKMRCPQCKRTNPGISFFKEYDPLDAGELVSEKNLFSLQQLDFKGGFRKRYTPLSKLSDEYDGYADWQDWQYELNEARQEAQKNEDEIHDILSSDNERYAKSKEDGWYYV